MLGSVLRTLLHGLIQSHGSPFITVIITPFSEVEHEAEKGKAMHFL